ncbi:hypothetical protein KUTeg_006233 [Tegillarca granosa]|uniref:Uncharacterized protein n=1 Tax=Tegillarca granosa TaxID=220873 RepID=A0ABQ9FG07_TEGGR|nr:hypothetical protein KUTeg_006233 [Tegillarca granosa]
MHLHKRDRSRPLGRMRWFGGFKSRWPHIKNCPESIYNIDEKSISNHHNPLYVVFSCTATPQAVTSPRGKITTILGCGNAIGQQLPPYYVFAGTGRRNAVSSSLFYLHTFHTYNSLLVLSVQLSEGKTSVRKFAERMQDIQQGIFFGTIPGKPAFNFKKSGTCLSI